MSTKLKISEIETCLFAGNSTFTLVRPEREVKVANLTAPLAQVVEGKKTVPEVRYTFKLTRAKGDEDSRPWFAKVMFGPDNESDFVFLGTVFTSEIGRVLRSSAKSPIKATDPRFLALEWLLGHLADVAAVELAAFEHKLTGQLFPPEELAEQLAGPVHELSRVEVWPSNNCSRCGRKLTVPSSVARFLGPECAEKVGVA